MARENQGLQIGLIIFVMLTVVLGASTFWMYKQYDEASIKLKAANDQLQAKDATLLSTESDLLETKRIVGADRTAKVADLSAQYDQDMNTYAGPTYADKGKGYRKALEYLSAQLKLRNGELADSKTEIEGWKRKFEAREASKEPQLKQFQAEAKKAQDDLAAERDKFKADADKLTKDQAELAAQLQGVRRTIAANPRDRQTKTNLEDIFMNVTKGGVQ